MYKVYPQVDFLVLDPSIDHLNITLDLTNPITLHDPKKMTLLMARMAVIVGSYKVIIIVTN